MFFRRGVFKTTEYIMFYSEWKERTTARLSRLPDNELRTIASGEDVDGARIANEILLDRSNKNPARKDAALMDKHPKR